MAEAASDIGNETSSSKSDDISTEIRPQFGTRFLTKEKNVFEHNAWDNVEWDEEQEEAAATKVTENSKVKVTDVDNEKYETDAHGFWDTFYGQHQNKFFKDRHWLFTEFPELAPMPQDSSDPLAEAEVASSEIARGTGETTWPGQHATRRFLEVGCGVGNTVFPVLHANTDPGLFVYCCDFSKTAVDIVKESPQYDPSRCHAFVSDISADDVTYPFPEGSLDVITIIFVLSAIRPERMQQTISKLARCLKPGGRLLFRDYGRYDLAQLRFKTGKCLGDNFYVRGDGTRVYFFTQDEVREMMRGAGLEEQQNLVDRRLQVNRGRQLKMYRVWIQAKYGRPGGDDTSS